MKIAQRVWPASEKTLAAPESWSQSVQLVLAFGARSLLEQEDRRRQIRQAYPNAVVLGCSTAGNIHASQILDEALVITAIQFSQAQVRGILVPVSDPAASASCGQSLANALAAPDLVHVFVVSDGLRVNGSQLVQGLFQALPPGVSLTGGLAGDMCQFEETTVLFGDQHEAASVAAVGFYGQSLRVGIGSLGGWSPFGPERLITRSQGNILYELDDQRALDIYKRYLGEHAAGLPATALHFPLEVRDPETQAVLVRTILSVNEADGSMIFAGDVPQGGHARLMKSNVTHLVGGAVEATRIGFSSLQDRRPQLALLISCVGRRLVMKQRVEEELEGVRTVLGPETSVTGFYSYGEISPVSAGGRCDLHNETMSVTLLAEA